MKLSEPVISRVPFKINLEKHGVIFQKVIASFKYKAKKFFSTITFSNLEENRFFFTCLFYHIALEHNEKYVQLL